MRLCEAQAIANVLGGGVDNNGDEYDWYIVIRKQSGHYIEITDLAVKEYDNYSDYRVGNYSNVISIND